MKTKGIAAKTNTDMIVFNIYFPHSLREYLSHRTDRQKFGKDIKPSRPEPEEPPDLEAIP